MSDRYTLGLVSVSFRDRAPREIAVEARKCGLDAIEWGSDVHARPDDADAISAIVEIDAELSLGCSSYGTYFRLGAGDESIPVNAPEDILPYLDAADALGTDTLRIWLGARSSKDYANTERDAILRRAGESAALAAARGKKLCSEFHLGTFNDCPGSARSLAGVGVGTYWQPFQTKTPAENLATARALRGAVGTVHVFNWSSAGRHPLADALDDWRRWLDALDGAKTLLLEFMPDDRLETLAPEAEALRRLAESVG